MNSSTHPHRSEALVFRAQQNELVRGEEQSLLAWLTPVVCSQSAALDLAGVERIDAAGIAALISLYARAHESGHQFSIVNPSAHVAEILSLVGLKPVLMEELICPTAPVAACMQVPAA
jgi:anti-anti-sigma factor